MAVQLSRKMHAFVYVHALQTTDAVCFCPNQNKKLFFPTNCQQIDYRTKSKALSTLLMEKKIKLYAERHKWKHWHKFTELTR